jgi:hypothetical protein
LPTLCLVYILRPRGYKSQQGRFKLDVDGETSQFLRLKEICMWQLEPQPSWEAAPGLMALYPLCRHGRSPNQAIAYAAGSIMAATTDTITRADLLTTLAIFGKLAYEQLDVVGLIGREHMKDSPLAAQIGNERAHEYILAVLEERFGTQAATSCREAVDRVNKADRLRRLHRLAMRCASLETFQRALRTTR